MAKASSPAKKIKKLKEKYTKLIAALLNDFCFDLKGCSESVEVKPKKMGRPPKNTKINTEKKTKSNK